MAIRAARSEPARQGRAPRGGHLQSHSGDFGGTLGLTPDGKSARARCYRGNAAESSDLLRVDLTSGSVTPLGLTLPESGVCPSSGRKIVFQAGREKMKSGSPRTS